MNKLQNIREVRKLVDGSHKSQTRKSIHTTLPSQNLIEKNKTRKVGDKWTTTDINGKVTYWEQKEGYQIKSGQSWDMQEIRMKLQEYLNSFRNCPKEKCECVAPNRLDEKFRKKTGMCSNCVFEMEHKMKMDGTYEEYEKKIMSENVKSWLADARNYVSQVVDDMSDFGLVFEDGRYEKWGIENEEQYREFVLSEFEKFEKELKQDYGIVDETEKFNT